MKKNLLLSLLVIILFLILVYPVGHFLNVLFLHESGGGFDVGPDTTIVEVVIGLMFLAPLLAFSVLGSKGRGNWKWLFAAILSAPSFLFFLWAGTYLWLPASGFILGLIIGVVLNKLETRS